MLINLSICSFWNVNFPSGRQTSVHSNFLPPSPLQHTFQLASNIFQRITNLICSKMLNQFLSAPSWGKLCWYYETVQLYQKGSYKNYTQKPVWNHKQKIVCIIKWENERGITKACKTIRVNIFSQKHICLALFVWQPCPDKDGIK